MDWFLYDKENFTYFVVFIPAKFSFMDIDN